MPTGDGLLARIHPPLGILTRAQIRAVAAASRAFGNGHVDVTARANLQLRGVTEATRPALVAALGGAGLGDMRADGGPQRLTLTSPLAGLTGEAVDVRAMASAIEAHGLAIAGLPPKTLVLIEGGGTDLSGIAADIHVRATGPGIAAVGLADEAGVTWIATCDEARTAEAVAGLLRAFATSGRRRIRNLDATERGSLVPALYATLADEPPPPSAGEGGPRSGSGERSGGSGKGAPPSRSSLTRCPPSPARGEGKPAVSLDACSFPELSAPFGRFTAASPDPLAWAAAGTCFYQCP
ncbi:hypothetical protein MKK68_16735, partial [Methylobacterium sp. E-016]|nr:hypothetical protein [Methylobacterium sp. E-016]